MAVRASTSSLARSFSSTSTPLASSSTATIPTLPTHARTRPLPLRKRVLYQSHLELLTASPAVLFLRPGHFSAEEWRSLRQGIAALPPSTPADPAAAGAPEEPAKPKLTLLRPGLLPALLRSQELGGSGKFDVSLLGSRSHIAGPLCALTLPELSPPTLHKLLALIDKVSSTPAPGADPAAAAKEEAPARLALLSSLVEARALDAEGTKRVSTLPGLDQLRAQIVGLLSMPASGLVGVLGARGRDLARTLQGFEEGLKPKAEPATEEKA